MDSGRVGSSSRAVSPPASGASGSQAGSVALSRSQSLAATPGLPPPQRASAPGAGGLRRSPSFPPGVGSGVIARVALPAVRPEGRAAPEVAQQAQIANVAPPLGAAAAGGPAPHADGPQVPGPDIEAQPAAQPAPGLTGLRDAMKQLKIKKQALEAARAANDQGSIDAAQAELAIAKGRAEDAVVAFSKNPGTRWSHALPVAKKLLDIAGAGTMATFGLARNGGIILARTLMDKVHFGSEEHPAGVGPSLGLTVMTIGAMSVSGTVLGAVGNFVGAKYAAPFINKLPQHRPIDADLVVPPRTVELMNQLDPGAGTALRESVAPAQSKASVINDPGAVRAGQWAFSIATLLSKAAPATSTPLEPKFGYNAAASAAAGTVVGAYVAIAMARARMEVPDRDALEAICQQEGFDAMSPVEKRAALADVTKHTIPLFYPDSKDENYGALDAIGKGHLGLKGSLKSIANRGWELSNATLLMGAIQTGVGGITGNSVTQRAYRGITEGAAIWTAISPWFNALAVSIPEQDRKLAEEAAAARAAAQPGDVEMAHPAQQPGPA